MFAARLLSKRPQSGEGVGFRRSPIGPLTIAAVVLLGLLASSGVALAQSGSGVFSLGSLLRLGCVMVFGIWFSQLAMLTIVARWVGLEGGFGRAFVAVLVGGVLIIVMAFPLLRMFGGSLSEWTAGVLMQGVSLLGLSLGVKWLFATDLKRAVLVVLLASAMTTVIIGLLLVVLYGL